MAALEVAIPRRSFYASSAASTSSSASIEGFSSKSKAFQAQSAKQRSKQRQLSDDSACEDASSAESSTDVQTNISENKEPLQVVVRKTILAFEGEAKSAEDIAKATRSSYARHRSANLVRLTNDIERVLSRQPCFVKDFLPDGTRVWTVNDQVSFLTHNELQAKVALKQVIELRKVLTSDQSAKIFAKAASRTTAKKYVHNKEAEDATSLDQLLDWSRIWKPHFEWRILVSCAILGSPRRMLRIEDIVKAINRKYPYRNVTAANVQKCLNKRPRFYSLKDKQGILWWRVDTEIPGSYMHTWKEKGKLATTSESQLRANASTYGRRLPSIPTTYALPLELLEQELSAQASYYAWKEARCANRAIYVDPRCAPTRVETINLENGDDAASVDAGSESESDKARIGNGPEAEEASEANAPSLAFSSDEADASSLGYDSEQSNSTTLGKRMRQDDKEGSATIGFSPYAGVKRRLNYIRSALHRITG